MAGSRLAQPSGQRTLPCRFLALSFDSSARLSALEFFIPPTASGPGWCAASAGLTEAGRKPFVISRQQKKQAKDAERLRKPQARFGQESAGQSGEGKGWC